MLEADYPLLTPHELEATGIALFGAAWRAPMAAALGVGERQVGLVEKGAEAAPADWRPKLIALAQDAALRAMEAAAELLWRHSEASADHVEHRPEMRLV